MGSVFHFRFQRLLELREREVELWEKRLAHQMLAVCTAEAAVQRLLAERAMLDAAWHAAVATELRADAGETFQLCFQELARRDQAAARVLETVRKEEADCRAALATALGRYKALEKLRERLHVRHRQQLARQEQAALDDGVMLRFVREAS